ncbi:DUF488 domain-containing protein [Brachybacterium sp. DNPG3]
MSSIEIDLERVHDVLDDGGSADGQRRVLVDRLWPRGVKKERLAYDEWDKDATPSPELRRAYHSGELGFAEFAGRYRRELDESGAAAALLERAKADGVSRLTLLFATKDVEQNHAQVLQQALRDAESGQDRC